LQGGKATLIFDTNFGTLVVRLKSRTAVTYCVTAIWVECGALAYAKAHVTAGKPL
jgi:hypothetical protein